jgi:hypothetical protein
MGAAAVGRLRRGTPCRCLGSWNAAQGVIAAQAGIQRLCVVGGTMPRGAVALCHDPLHGRGAAYFLCLAKESKQRKARLRRRRLRRFLALLGQAGGRRNSHDRACGAPRASDSQRPKPRLALRCSASSKANKVKGSPLTLALSPSGERESYRSRRSTDRLTANAI